ncbi:MAG: glutamate synthase central domain-containing protein, partial [Cyanobacteria bacterium P01_D01_bin.2]
MGNKRVDNVQLNQQSQWLEPSGPKSLVEERDACGVGFIADQQGRASHRLVTDALHALSCMEHRGGCCADQDSGDGAGIMTAIPWKILQPWATEYPLTPGHVGVGMTFLPRHGEAADMAKQQFAQVAQAAGFTVLGWRPVPVASDTLGSLAKEFEPQIEQVLVESAAAGDELERRLFLLRRAWMRALEGVTGSDELTTALQDIYVCSFSSRTMVYKGMVRSEVLGQFYLDLQDSNYESAFAVYHRRFSTNTMPKWPLAHPMRLLGHNGEINTLIGNINWMMAREADLASPVGGESLEQLKPIVNADNSDSANLDNVMELLVRSGRTPTQTLMMMVPEAYLNQPDLLDYPEITDFYDYYSGVQEPWDGPALIVFSDGKQVGATLDRNGLRPARYAITRSGYLVVSSEAGVVDLPTEEVVEKGRLGPGEMIAIDFETHEILKNWEIKQRVAQGQPYGDWVQSHRHDISPQLFREQPRLEETALLTQQTAFGYTAEDLEMTIQDMASQGKEPTYCMGNDAPLAVLSEKPHLLYNYFKQRFAQVTNPPIDPLRERLVMSLQMQLGQRHNLLDEQPSHLLKLGSPVVNDNELELIRQGPLSVTTLSTLYAVGAGPAGLDLAIETLCAQADTAVKAGAEVLILSDRIDGDGRLTRVSAGYIYIPPLVAVGAIHHHLIGNGLRLRTSILVDTAQCWSTHHFACLV